jgi:hypothetical protein
VVRTVRTRGVLQPLPLAGLVAVAVGLTVAAAIGTDIQGADFESQVSPALDALVRGEFHTLCVNFPLMGPVSVLLRAPFDWLVFDADIRVVYLVTSLPLLVAYVGVVLWLMRRIEAHRPQVIAAVIGGLVLVNPAVVRAIHWGHPEDLLCAALLLAAALTAASRDWWVTGLLLGLAIATKQWALLAFPAIVLAVPVRRVAAGGLALVLVAAITLPFALEAPSRFRAIAKATSNTEAFWHTGENKSGVSHVTPANVIWPFSERRHETRAGVTAETAVLSNGWVRVTHVLIGLFALLLTWAGWRNRRAGPETWLGVLAAIFLVRCLFDPVNFDYYHVTALLFLGAWEGLARRSAPLLTAIAVIGMGITFAAHAESFAALYQHALFMNVTYLLWMLPLTVYVASRSYAGSVKNSGSSSDSAVAMNNS